MADYDKLYPTKKDKNDRIKELEKLLAMSASKVACEGISQRAMKVVMRDRTNAKIECQRLKDENAALRIEIDELRKHIADDIEHDVQADDAPSKINEVKVQIEGWSLTFDRDTLKAVKRG